MARWRCTVDFDAPSYDGNAVADHGTPLLSALNAFYDELGSWHEVCAPAVLVDISPCQLGRCCPVGSTDE